MTRKSEAGQRHELGVLMQLYRGDCVQLRAGDVVMLTVAVGERGICEFSCLKPDLIGIWKLTLTLLLRFSPVLAQAA
jgi:hypothetical protein